MAAAPGLAELDRIEAQLREAEAEYFQLSNATPSSSSQPYASAAAESSRPSPSPPKSPLSQPLYSFSGRQTGQQEEVPAARVDAALFSRLQLRHHPSSPAPEAARSTRRPLPNPTSETRIHASKPTVSQTLLRLAQPRHEIYAERERQRQEREAVKAAQENCTFTPTLCQGTEKRAAALAAASKGEVPKSLPDRLRERQEAAEAARRCRQAKFELEQAAECTFQPVLYTDQAHLMPGSAFLSSPSSSPCSSPSRRPGHDKPLHERLGDVQRARRDHLDRLRAREEEKQAAEWTFRPRLCGVTEEMARQRRQDQDDQYLYDRCIYEDEDEEEEHQQQQQQQQQQQPLKGGTTFDYLAHESQRFLQRRMAKRWALEQEQLAECHFAPRLCEKTEELIANAGLPLDFESRQYVWEEQRQRKASVIEARKAAEEGRWFKPALEPQSEAMVARLRQRLEQEDHDGGYYHGNEPVVRRLAVKETARREAARQHRTEVFYAQYRFQPSLNPVSRALGRPSTTDELAYNWRGEIARNKVAEEAQARFDAECTFQPVLLSSSSSSSSVPPASSALRVPAVGAVTKTKARTTGAATSSSVAVASTKAVVATAQLAQPSVSIAAGWEDRRRAKDALAAEARATREAEELQACTWQPQLATKAIPTRRRQEQQQSPVLVRGLGKFIARTQAAVQQREERTAAAACLAAGGAKRTGVLTVSGAGQVTTTMPRPFQLSSRPQGQRGSHATVRAEVEKLTQATLTFRPQTIERRKQAALQKLLHGGV
jgi:hypothetical protein